MKNIILRIGAVLCAAFISGHALAQSFDGEIGAGHVLGNPSAAQATATDATVTAIFDRALCGTNGAIISRVGGTWGCTTLTGVLQGNGTSAVTAITNSSTVGQTLRVTGASTYAWGALDIANTSATTGNLPVSRLNSGTNASATTFWRGDATWVTGREVITANRDYYVRTDGSDSNTCLANTAPAACLTVQAAVNKAQALDTAGFSVTINIADGTYTGAIAVSYGLIGGGVLIFQGNSTTPDNVLISPSGSGIAFNLYNKVRADILGMRITGGSGSGLRVDTGSNVQLNKVNFGAAANGALDIGTGAVCTAVASFTIFGNSLYWLHVAGPGTFTTSTITITMSGTPAFGTYTIGTSNNGNVDLRSVTFSGAATGSRFTVHQGAVILPPSASLTAIPGSTAGTEGSGGVYFMGEPNIIHDISIDTTTASTTTTTGALKVAGGIGVVGDINWAGGAWTAYTPTVTASTGTFTTISATGAWKRYGKAIVVRVAVTLTTIGTASVRMIITTPVGVDPTGTNVVHGFNITSGKAISGLAPYDTGSSFSVRLYDGSFPGTSGDSLYFTVVYETASRRRKDHDRRRRGTRWASRNRPRLRSVVGALKIAA